MNYYAISSLIIALSSLAFGLFIYFRNTKDSVNKIFLFLSLAVFVFGASYFFWQMTDGASQALFWNRALMFGAILIAPLYFHLALALTWQNRVKTNFIIGSYLLFLIFLIADFTNLFISGVRPIAIFDYWSVPGPLFHPFLALWLGYGFWATFILYKAYKTSECFNLVRFKWIMLGMIVGLLAGSTNYFYWYNIPIPPVLHIFSISYIVSIAYLIFKRN